MTEAQYEDQDFSWQNIRGWFVIVGIIALASYVSKKK